VGSCTHNPPRQYGSPNGVFPMRNGHFLVTEINGDWVDEIDTAGHVYWTTHAPQVYYPSDSNQIGLDPYLTVDYSSPGQAVIFNQAGAALWRYAPMGGAGGAEPPVARHGASQWRHPSQRRPQQPGRRHRPIDV
jgi:hypothetical protein